MKKTKAGVLAYRNAEQGREWLLFTSNNPVYGGPDPQIPKGHVDPGEDVQTAALREFEEETGIRATELTNIERVFDGVLSGLDARYRMVVFVAECKTGIPRPTEEGECQWIAEEKATYLIQASQFPILLKAIGAVSHPID